MGHPFALISPNTDYYKARWSQAYYVNKKNLPQRFQHNRDMEGTHGS